MTRTPFVAGNWKMNGLSASLAEVAALEVPVPGPDVAICPPATLISGAVDAAAGRGILIGGQDCHGEPGGAHTGDLAAEMLADLGARCVIVGHSERRADHDESDGEIAAKVEAAWRAGLLAILCVGESAEDRDAGRAEPVVTEQLAASLPAGATPESLVVAYEPVWAIGSGRTPTTDEIGAMHSAIRAALAERIGDAAEAVRILYGGSVSGKNAVEIAAVDGVDGALVGGASLTAEKLAPVISAFAARAPA